MNNNVSVRILMIDGAGQVWHVDVNLRLASTMQYLILREVGEWLRSCENLEKKDIDIGGLTLYGAHVLKQVKSNGEQLGGAVKNDQKSTPLMARMRSCVSR